MPRKVYDEFALPYGAGSLVERPTGWLARWQERGRGRSQLFPSRKAAHTFLLDRWQRLQSGRYVDASQMTVRFAVDQWIERGDFTPSTYATHQQRARRLIYPELGDALLVTLSSNRVQQWVDGLRRLGYAPSTIQAAHSILAASLQSAVDLRVIEENVALRVKRPRVEQRPVTVWTPAQARQVLASTVDDPLWHAFYWVALTTGIRPGELRTLQWPDVDFGRGVLSVQRTITRTRENRVAVGTQTKTKKPRVIVLVPQTVQALERWKLAQRVTRLPAFVFTQQDGNRISQTTCQRHHARLCAEMMLPRITLHQLRHSAATLMLELGVPAKIVQEILGHRSIRTTLDTYVHVSEAMQRQALESVEQTLSHLDSTGQPSRQQSR